TGVQTCALPIFLSLKNWQRGSRIPLFCSTGMINLPKHCAVRGPFHLTPTFNGSKTVSGPGSIMHLPRLGEESTLKLMISLDFFAPRFLRPYCISKTDFCQRRFVALKQA